MIPFPHFQGSRTSLFSGLPAGDPFPLRIPFDWLRAAASPTSKPRKDSVLPPVTSEKLSSFTFLLESFRELHCGIISFTFQRPSVTGKRKVFLVTSGERGSLRYALDMGDYPARLV
jgi:hypothetical protein